MVTDIVLPETDRKKEQRLQIPDVRCENVCDHRQKTLRNTNWIVSGNNGSLIHIWILIEIQSYYQKKEGRNDRGFEIFKVRGENVSYHCQKTLRNTKWMVSGNS